MVGIISSLSLEAFDNWIFHALLFEGAGDRIVYLNLLVVYRINVAIKIIKIVYL